MAGAVRNAHQQLSVLVVTDVVVTANGVARQPEQQMVLTEALLQLAIRQDRALQQGGVANRVVHLAVDLTQAPVEPVTLLELVAFMVGRDLLRTFEGTILWSGIESLRHKIERDLPPSLIARLEGAKQVFHVKSFDPARYSARPRLISTLSAAITDCREIEIDERPDASGSAGRRRLRPLRLVIEPPRVQLLGIDVAPDQAAPPVFIDIDRIDKVTPLDITFAPPPVDPEALLAAQRARD